MRAQESGAVTTEHPQLAEHDELLEIATPACDGGSDQPEPQNTRAGLLNQIRQAIRRFDRRNAQFRHAAVLPTRGTIPRL